MSNNTNVIRRSRVVGLEIEIALRDEMVRFIQQRIIINLEATQQFLGLNVTRFDEICAGIYTYAIEEYGKILYLRNLNPLPPPNNNRVRVRYTNDNHGFLDHTHKFELSLNDNALPSSCKVLRQGGFTTTGFTSTGFVTDTPANFEARMSIFYTDFDEHMNYNSILPPQQVDRNLLVQAVDDFLQFIRSQNYP
jgi:hypothetical protein